MSRTNYYSELTQNYIGNQRAIDNEDMWNEYYWQKEEDEKWLSEFRPISFEETEEQKRMYDEYLKNKK